MLLMLLFQFLLSQLGVDCMNKNTVLIYALWLPILLIGLPLVEKQRKRSNDSFILPFMVFTTIQFLFILGAVVTVNVLLPNEFANFALQLSLSFFAILAIQSWVFLGKNN